METKSSMKITNHMHKLFWVFRYIKRSLSIRKKLAGLAQSVTNWQKFWRSYSDYKALATAFGEEVPDIEKLYPCLGDDTAETAIEPVYFYQDTWAFEQIVKVSPSEHIDVGSHHKFVAFLSKVFSVTMVDIRPLSLSLASLQFKQGSILQLPFADGSVESLSSLCVVEHIGLGRYGDPLDIFGSEKAVSELCRVLSPNGHLYISVPVNNENKIFFNAHRAFEEEYFENLLSSFEIIDRKYISGNTLLTERPHGYSIALYHAVKS